VYPFVSDPPVLLSIGFPLIVSIYVQVALLFGVYTPELFPTEVRLRANGIVNMLGRAATVVSPFIVVALFTGSGVARVVGLMIGLLTVQIVVVALWSIEPARRPLEAMAAPRLAVEPSLAPSPIDAGV
jgi:MFS transporter, putative metabolite:H+ symporter